MELAALEPWPVQLHLAPHSTCHSKAADWQPFSCVAVEWKTWLHLRAGQEHCLAGLLLLLAIAQGEQGSGVHPTAHQVTGVTVVWSVPCSQVCSP
jgi:hypothetical protein